MFTQVRQRATRHHDFRCHNRTCFRHFGRTFNDGTRFVITRVHVSRCVTSVATGHRTLSTGITTLATGGTRRPAAGARHRLKRRAHGLTTTRGHLGRTTRFTGSKSMLPTTTSLFIRRPHRIVCLFSNDIRRCGPFCTSTLVRRSTVLRFYIRRKLSHCGFCNVSNIFSSPSSRKHNMLRFGRNFGKCIRRLPNRFILPIGPITCIVGRFTRGLLSQWASTTREPFRDPRWQSRWQRMEEFSCSTVQYEHHLARPCRSRSYQTKCILHDSDTE